MKKLCCLLILCCLFVGNAFADGGRGQCVSDAAKSRNEAIAAAKDLFEIARVSCQGPCHEACANSFTACVGPFRATFEQCSTTAQQAFAAARESCRVSTNCGELSSCFENVAFQQCLVQPRVDRRVALKACSKALKDGVAAAGCRTTFKSCRNVCRAEAKKARKDS